MLSPFLALGKLDRGKMQVLLVKADKPTQDHCLALAQGIEERQGEKILTAYTVF